MLLKMLRLTYNASSKVPLINPKKSILMIHPTPHLQFSIQHHFVPYYFMPATEKQASTNSIYLNLSQPPSIKSEVQVDANEREKVSQSSNIMTKKTKNKTQIEQNHYQIELGFGEVKKLLKWNHETSNQITLIKSTTQQLIFKYLKVQFQPSKQITSPSLMTIQNTHLQIILSHKQKQKKVSLTMHDFQTIKTILNKSIPFLINLENFYEDGLEQMIQNFESMIEKNNRYKSTLEKIGDEYLQDEINNGKFIP